MINPMRHHVGVPASWNIDTRWLLALALHGNSDFPEDLGMPHDLVSPTEELVRLAALHGVASEVQRGAEFLGATDLASSLAVLSRVWKMEGLRLVAETRGVIGILQGAGIPCVVLKGIGTAAMTRVEAIGRRSSDVDILVRPVDVMAACKALEQAGYLRTPRTPEPTPGVLYDLYLRLSQEGGFSNGRRAIDLHWHMGFARQYLPTADEVISEAEMVEVAGVTLPVPTVTDALTHAVLHWRYGGFARLKYVLDVLGFEAVAVERGADLGALALPVRSGVAMAKAMVKGYGALSSTPPPSGVRRWEWELMRRHLTPTPAGDSYFRQRVRTVFMHYRTTPGLIDRLEIPARSAAGPLLRAWQKRAAKRP